MKPLLLITNDDGLGAKGLKHLYTIAQEFGDVVVMAPERNASAKSLSLTTTRPLRARDVEAHEGLSIHCCDGTPVDCIKLATEYFCPRKPDLVLSGINHGSNSSINVIYSGTMGAAIEATTLGINAIGFSLLSHNPDADFTPSLTYVRHILGQALEHGLPSAVALNVNIPKLPADQIKGIRICHQAKASWSDSFEKRIDPIGRPYYWLTGKFNCDDPSLDSDEQALRDGYVSVVPIQADYTCYGAIANIQYLAQ